MMQLGDLVPNTFIKSADNEETIFCTGLFYSLRHKELNAPVTYLPASSAPVALSGEPDNILVVRNNHEYYFPRGNHANSTLFAFRKLDEFYQLFHRELAAPVTYDPSSDAPVGKVPPDNILVVRNRSHSAYRDYQAGGQGVNSTLFSVKKDGSFFKLVHKELEAPVTYVPSDFSPIPRVGDPDDVLVVRNISHPIYTSYQPGGQWEHSTLFSFVPEKYRLKAGISNFKYADWNCRTHATVVDTETAMVWSVRNESQTETEVHNVQISKVLESVTSWEFADGEERRFFQQDDVDVSISAHPCSVSGGLYVDADSSTDVQLCSTGDLVRWNKTDTSLEEAKIVTSGGPSICVTLDVHVPPKHATDYHVDWKRVEVKSIPFTAQVKVTALADRMCLDGSVREMTPVDPDGVLSLMRSRGYKGVFWKEGDNVLTTISGTVCVSGVIKGEMTHRDVVLSSQG